MQGRPEDEPERVREALASPVRRRLLARLRAGGAPSAAELAASESLHVTTVRFHLEQLMDAGLVAAVPERSAQRGRPRLTYLATPQDPDDVRAGMIDALAQAAAGPGTPEENAEAAGRCWAAGVTLAQGSTAHAVTDVLTRLGFDPEAAPEDPAGPIRLRTCPFREAARRTPQVVCRVHAGFLREVADRTADGAGLRVALEPFATPTTCHVILTSSRTSSTAGAPGASAHHHGEGAP